MRWQWCLRLRIDLIDVVDPPLAAVVFGWLELILWDKKTNHGSLFPCFVSILVLVVLFGLISPYSFELGLGHFVVPWWWRYSRGRFDQYLVYSCCQFADERSLHVVWYVWDTVWKRAIVFMAVVYEVLSRLLGLFFTSSLWKAISVVRVWALSAHDICNRFGLRFMSPPFLGMCVVLSSFELWVRKILQLVAPVLCSLSS